MKIAIITDIHHGPASHAKKPGWDALPVLERFIAWAEAEGADLVLDLGDHISDVDEETDAVLAREVAARFAAFPRQRVHILGNHDVAGLSVAQNEAIFGQPMSSRVVGFETCRLIAWQPDVRMIRPVGFAPAGGAHLDWLVAALQEDERPAIIASHVPVSGHSQVGNYYFERNAQFATYPDHASIRLAVEATGRAAVWISGHVHWNTLTNVRGIQHVTIQSMSERFTTMPEPACAHAMLEIEDGSMSLSVHGNDPFHARLPFRRSGDRPWIAPMEPFWTR